MGEPCLGCPTLPGFTDPPLPHAHLEGQMRVPGEDDIGLYPGDLRRPLARSRRDNIGTAAPWASRGTERIDNRRWCAPQSAEGCAGTRAAPPSTGVPCSLHGLRHLPERPGAPRVRAGADRIIVIPLDHQRGVPADEIHHLRGIRTVVHQVAKHPQLVMRFRQDGFERLQVGVNVGNEGAVSWRPSGCGSVSNAACLRKLTETTP